MKIREAFICDGIRTPIGRYGGGLSSIRADDLAVLPIKALLKRNPSVDPKAIEELIWGAANQAGEDNRNIGRIAALLAGLPVSVAGVTVNRLCGSGMDAVLCAYRTIACDHMDLVIAGGSESMSRAPFVIPKGASAFSRQSDIFDTTIGWRFINPRMSKMYGHESMPETAENVARAYNISREDQDRFAWNSHKRYQQAKQRGFYDGEILPVTHTIEHKGTSLTLDVDEHPRESTLKDLAALPSLFGDHGTITAGNSSGINDGACALLIADKTMIKYQGLTPRVRIFGGLSIGVEPRLMGMGPAYAAEKLLHKHQLSFDDIDVIELNEAFASQTLATMRYWGLQDDDARVNPNGGAISLGHPLGMSGARLILTAIRRLEADSGKYALCTMCIGVGQGIAILLTKEI